MPRNPLHLAGNACLLTAAALNPAVAAVAVPAVAASAASAVAVPAVAVPAGAVPAIAVPATAAVPTAVPAMAVPAFVAVPSAAASAGTVRAADAALPRVRSVSLPVDGSFTGPNGTVHVKGTLDVTVVTLPGAAGGGTAQVISSLDDTTGAGVPGGKTYYLVGAHRDTAPFSAAATTTFHIRPALLLVPPSGAPGRVQPLTVSVTVTSTGVIDTVTAAVG
ncbi:hypothetical protein [Streptomyces sp. NPDC048385]|uniref:hypothetical protein n=1 Tax=Streptomyces sp. NPDC048385 TaxID=3155145 RepID=UPI00342C7CB9